ncbi:pantetheine-phosphate adenylyltransferase [Flavobacteriaceae bacterium]|nr:pantetheine-phosphate adenylyltransferase [Flavobacteriaceae bacterium]
MKKAVFPGSFDPITIGHLDIVKRGIKIFDEIIIAIGDNTDKKYLFSKEKRVEFVERTFSDYDKVKIESYNGLTVDFCKKNNIEFMIRGLRNPADFEFEKSIALTNREMTGIETIFFLTSPENSFISSSIVRDLIRKKGDYKLFIPKGIIL